MALNVRLPALITNQAILPDCPDFDRPISRSDRAEGLPVPGCRLESCLRAQVATPPLRCSDLCVQQGWKARGKRPEGSSLRISVAPDHFGACSRRVDHVNSEAFLRRSPSLRATIDA